MPRRIKKTIFTPIYIFMKLQRARDKYRSVTKKLVRLTADFSVATVEGRRVSSMC